SKPEKPPAPRAAQAAPEQKPRSQRQLGDDAAAPPAAPEKPQPPPGKATSVPGREEEVVPMSRLRRTVAENLVAAQHNAALLTTSNEIDMSGVMAMGKEYGGAFQKK